MPETREVFKLEVVGAIATGVKDRWVAQFSGEIVDAKGVVGTAPTGSTAIIDIQKNGATIYRTSPDNRPTIAISGTAFNTPPAWAATTAYVVGQRVTVSAQQAGANANPGVYEALIAHTSGASFQVAPSGGYGSGAAPAGIGGTPTWQQLPANNAPTPGLGSFVAGDSITLNIIQVGSTVAGSDLDVDVEYLPL